MENETTPPPPKKHAVKIDSFQQLSEIVRAPKTLQVQFGETLIECNVIALSEDEWAAINKIGADVKAPTKTDPKTKQASGAYDEEDPDYQAKLLHAYEMRRTAALDKGLAGLSIPGETLEEKNTWRRANLPPQAVDALFAGIRMLTTDAPSLAHFISDAG